MAGRPAGRAVMAAAEVGLEGGGAPTGLRPDAATQRSELMPLLKMVLRPGESWYLIDSRWFKQWKKFVGFESWDLYNVGEPNLFPGPIDNSGLFTDSETQTLKEHLIDELDYVLVPTEAWDKLASWYGCMEGQKPIVRKVVEYGLFVKHCKVEVYLLELKLCQDSDPTNLVDSYFSKADTIATIEKEMRKQFNIPDGKEVRLWNRCTSNAYELLSKLDSTIQDAGLYQGQVVLIELKNEDGSWPRQSSLTKMTQKQMARSGQTKGASPAHQPSLQQQQTTQQAQQQHQVLTVQHLQEAVRDLKDSMSSKLENMSSKLGNMSSKWENMEETMVSELEDMKHQMLTQNKETRQDIIAAFTGLAGHVQIMEKEMEEVKQTTTELDQRTERLEKENLMLQYREMEFALRIRGAKEIPQEDIKQMCSDAFGALMQADPKEFYYDIDRIFRVNSWFAKQKKLPRDIVVYFTRRSVRDMILQACYHNKLQIAGQEVLVFKEIPPRMLRQRREFKFLTDELKKRGCQFRWDVPIGLVVDYSGVRHRLNTIMKAKEFYSKILCVDGSPKNDQPSQALALEGSVAKDDEIKDQRVTRVIAKKREQQGKQQIPPQQPNPQQQQLEVVGSARSRRRFDLQAAFQRLQAKVDHDKDSVTG